MTVKCKIVTNMCLRISFPHPDEINRADFKAKITHYFFFFWRRLKFNIPFRELVVFLMIPDVVFRQGFWTLHFVRLVRGRRRRRRRRIQGNLNWLICMCRLMPGASFVVAVLTFSLHQQCEKSEIQHIIHAPSSEEWSEWKRKIRIREKWLHYIAFLLGIAVWFCCTIVFAPAFRIADSIPYVLSGWSMSSSIFVLIL